VRKKVNFSPEGKKLLVAYEEGYTIIIHEECSHRKEAPHGFFKNLELVDSLCSPPGSFIF